MYVIICRVIDEHFTSQLYNYKECDYRLFLDFSISSNLQMGDVIISNSCNIYLTQKTYLNVNANFKTFSFMFK